MLLHKKMETYSGVIITVFMTMFFLFIHRQSFFLFPIHEMLRLSWEHDEFVLDNDIGVWFHPPMNSTTSNQLIIYFNGNSGNMSTRSYVMRFIRHEFPEYGIAQFDYPGYGLSSHLPLHYRDMVEISVEVTDKLVKRFRPDRLGLWSESLGAMVMMHVYQKSSIRIDWMIQVNGVCDLKRAIQNVVIWPMYMLIAPFIPERETVASLYKKRVNENTKYILFHAREDSIVLWREAVDLYLDIMDQNVHMALLDGRHENAIHLKENQELIHKTIEGFL
jgi:pimeloyl-ACP methyl ester carboxylesterase